MKTKLYKFAAPLVIPLLYYFIMAGFKPTETTNGSRNITLPSSHVPGPSTQKDFVNFILNCDYNFPPETHAENFWRYYRNELKYNGLQLYDADTGTWAFGWFNKNIEGSQKTYMDNMISDAHTNGLKAIYERSNMSNLCYAQRLVYEVANGSGHNDVNDGFCYQNISGMYETETDGTTAIHACVNPEQCNQQNWDAIPQYICSNIYENFQHTDLPEFRPHKRDLWEWHLKPRMKIKQSDFNDPNKQTLPVVTIEAYCFNDGNGNTTPIATKTILVRNFSKQGIAYLGDYKEIFYNGLDVINMWIPGNKTNGLNKGRNNDYQNWGNTGHANECHVDFKIWWHGNVDVWFDKLTVDDFRANKLFDPNPANNYNQFLNAELTNFGSTMDIFFVDELVHSQIPSARYVVDKVRAYDPNIKITVAATNFLNILGLKNDNMGFRPLIEGIKPDYFQPDAHKLFGWREDNGGSYHDAYYPDNVTPTDALVPTGYSPSGWKASYSTYTDWMQGYIFGDRNTRNPGDPAGTLVYQFRIARDQADNYSSGTRVIMQPQIHSHLFDYDNNGGNGKYDEGVREPTNEEYSAQAMIAIAHGADGLSWFWFQSIPDRYTGSSSPYLPYFYQAKSTSRPTDVYQHGLINFDYSRRTQNMWGQNKWTGVGGVNEKILTWKPTLDAITWQSGWSVHSETANHEFITDILSIDPHKPPGTQNPCTNDYQTELLSTGPWLDCPDERYWEMGFFDNIGFTKYFIAVNRRCVPEAGSSDGDDRILKIKFDITDFPVFENWAITDINTSYSKTFAKNSQGTLGYLDLGSTNGGLGWFEPGEGKLFKIEPVPVKGGTLVADENISNQMFTCLDTVYNNGYNITIDSGTTISFTDSAAIIMNGGTFTSGVLGSPAGQQVTYKGSGSADWNGLRFNQCTVKVYNSKFQDIASPVVNYAIKMVDCQLADIRTNRFVLDTDTAGAVQSVYIQDPFGSPVYAGLYVNYNDISMGNSRSNAVCVQGFSGITLPFYAMNNIMSSNGYATGVMLSTVTGGVIKSNQLTGFSTGINLMFSTVDLFGNQISNTTSESKGIMCSGSGTMELVPVSGLWLGGANTITNTSGGSRNIDVDNSIFVTDGGNNTFDVSSSGYHLYGTVNPFTFYPTDHRYNCFAVNGTETSSPSDYVTDGMSEIIFTYTDFTCNGSLPEGISIVDIGNGLYDTIPNSGGGMGGGKTVESSKLKVESSKLKVESSKLKVESSKAKINSQFTIHNSPFVLTSKQLHDSIRVNLRKRNYGNVKTYCNELLNNYPNTYEALCSLEPLYISTVATDTTTSGLTALKTMYETLILNNGTNTALVRASNYLVQKCKVLLGDYISALSGFQQIINNAPYSYMGLLARWDYMATTLLAPQGGSQSMSNEQLTINNIESDKFDEYDEFEKFDELNDDKSPFSREERKVIKTSINSAFEVTRNDDGLKIKKLEERSNIGEVSAEKELKIMKTLKDVVKSQKPKNITEHISIVSSDVQKVFGNTSPAVDNKNNNVPQTFSLSQNFPNPFNPVTTIKYALPADVKVVVKIYDILGREVRTIVNELQKAGYYEVKFDGTNYASGVYFYRIEADNFAVSKKMVLVK